MDRLSAIEVFAQVVELGSFSAAASKLGVSATAASRQVADLEAHLQTRLLHRTTRRVSLTESGRSFYERAVQILADLREAEDEASHAAVVPRGTIRLASAVAFAPHLAPVIAEFLSRHTQVRFDVSLSDRMVDLVEEGFDLAIRIGATGSDNLVARKIGETRIVPCASPAYLASHPAPADPEALAAHNCFTYEYVKPSGVWHFRDPDGADRVVRVGGNVHSNSAGLHAELAACGVGIVFEPAFIVGPEIRAGRLVPLLQDFEPAPLPIYAVYPSRRHLSAKVRVFVDFIMGRFAAARDWVLP